MSTSPLYSLCVPQRSNASGEPKWLNAKTRGWIAQIPAFIQLRVLLFDCGLTFVTVRYGGALPVFASEAP